MTALFDWARTWRPSSSATPELLLTRGGGEHLGLLEERFPGALLLSWAPRGAARVRRGRVLVEPEAALFAAAAQRALALGLNAYLANPPDAACPERPSEVELAEAVGILSRRATVEQGTLRAAARECLPNLEENLPVIFGEGIPLGSVVQSLSGAPVLVAGSGPSLPTIFPGLSQARDQLFVMAASSALRPLYDAGIRPDAVAILETRDRLGHFEGIPASELGRMILFADSGSFPGHLALPFGAKIVFHGAPGRWLAPIFGENSLVPNGGNIGTAMLVMAWMLGAQPVLAAGLDFAAPAGQHYAAGSGSSGMERKDAPKAMVPGWDGAPLEAGIDLVGYREQTETLLAGIAQLDGQARFEAVTLGGARVEGMQPTGWDAACRALPRELSHGFIETVERIASQREGLFREPSAREAIAGLEATLERIRQDPAGPVAAYVFTDPSDALLSMLVGSELLQDREEPQGLASGASPAIDRALGRVRSLGARGEELQRR